MTTKKTLNTVDNANSGEKSDAQKQAIEQGKRDTRVQEIIRKDTAIVYAATLKRLSRAVFAEELRNDVCEIVTIGNVTAHHSQPDMYIISLRVTHKYIGKVKNFRVQAMPQIKFAYNAAKNTVHAIGTPETDEKKAIVTYGAPLAQRYFARMNALNAGLSMEEMMTLRPFNMLAQPEFAKFVTAKKNVTQAELNVIADEYAAKVMPE